MEISPKITFTSFVALLVYGVSPSVAAQGRETPFDYVKEPAAVAAAEPKQMSQRLSKLEFAGYMSLRGSRMVNIYDPTNQRSYWIELDEGEDGIAVSDFKESEGSLMVKLGGENRRISLNNISIVEIKNYNPKPAKIVIPKTDLVKKQEEDARKMVSDILVKGMERRKKRKAERAARLKERQKKK